MSAPLLLTVQDCFEYAIHYQEGHAKSAHQAMLASVLHSAYMELGQEFDWSFLHKQGRIGLKGPISTGQCTYNASNRVLTFSHAVLTADMVDWSVRILGIPCHVESVLSATTATLDAVMNPARDIPNWTSYRLYPSYYILPNDVKRIMMPRVNGMFLVERSYDDIMALERDYDQIGLPACYCVRGVEDLYGVMGIWLHPACDYDRPLDFIYERRPREIRYTGHRPNDRAGTISVTAGSATVAGTGTAFDTGMIGSILRISSSPQIPTGWRGANPYVEQRSILHVGSPTSLMLDAHVSTTRSGVGYTISDPVDIDPNLHQCLLDGMVRQMAFMQAWDDRDDLHAKYMLSIQKARASDKSSGRRVMGGLVRQKRLKDIAVYTGDS